MFKIIPLLVLLQKTQRTGVVFFVLFNNIFELIEINIIPVSDNLSLLLSLYTFLGNSTRFVVEKTQGGVAQIRNCSDKHTIEKSKLVI